MKSDVLAGVPAVSKIDEVMFTITVYDDCPTEESAIIDQGIGDFNDMAAPLHEVQAISCFAKPDAGKVLGGAIGRIWGEYCELQQLWVTSAHRQQGIGSQLLKAFEAHAKSLRCEHIYLETFSFQSPKFYVANGYLVEYERRGFPHGIVKFHLAKRL